MHYVVKILVKDLGTLYWLADRGYDGNFLHLADLNHYETPDGEEDEGDDYGFPHEDSIAIFWIDEPKAWEFDTYVTDDYDAFLTCNGSQTLEKALVNFYDNII